MLELKNLLKIFLVIIILFTTNGFTQKINQKNTSGKRTGIWKKEYKSGNLRYTGQFRNGKEVGTFKFYPNKEKAQIPEVTKEFMSSGITKVTYFNDKGKIKAEGQMQGKNRIGAWKFYYEDGKLMSIENYKNGKLDGLSKNFYTNGKTTAEIYYTNGIKNGVSKTYTDDGFLIESVNFKNGIYHGKAEFYSLKGKLTEKGTYINGSRSDADWNYYDAEGGVAKKPKRKVMKIK